MAFAIQNLVEIPSIETFKMTNCAICHYVAVFFAIPTVLWLTIYIGKKTVIVLYANVFIGLILDFLTFADIDFMHILT